MQLVLRGKNAAKVHRIKRKSLIGQLVLILLSMEVLFFASFTAFELPTATERNLKTFLTERVQAVVDYLPLRLQQSVYESFPKLQEATTNDVRYALYVPQGASAVFIGYALGWPLAAIAGGLFLLVGLAGPLFNFHPFAAGGGLNYYQQPGFGYLVGMVLAAAVVGLITKEHRTTFRQLLALVSGLFVMHLVGLGYLVGVCLFFSVFEDAHNLPGWSQWVFEQARNLTWYALPYDFLFGMLMIGAGFPFRWLARTLIAPDIAFRNNAGEQQGLSAVGPVRG